MGEHHGVEQPETPGERHRRQERERREEIGSKEQSGERRERNTKAQVKEKRHQALHHQPSGQRVDTEERGQPPHDAARAMQLRSKALPQALDLDGRTHRRFHRRGKAQGQPGHDEAQHRVHCEQEADAGGKGQPGSRQEIRESCRQRSDRRTQ